MCNSRPQSGLDSPPGRAAQDPKLSSRILIAISICYGITVAILGYLESPAIGTFAFIGALAIGGLWAIRGLFLKR